MPLTPNQWQHSAGQMQRLFFTAELKLLEAMKKRLASGIDYPGWENLKYSQRQAMRRDARVIVDELTVAAKQLYQEQLEAAYTRAAAAGTADLHKVLTNPLVNVSPARSYRLQTVLEELSGRMRQQYLRILRTADDSYFRVIGQAVAESQASSVTLRQSVQRSLSEFARMGIRGFTDGAGRSWGISEYAEMATRTGMMNAALAGYADAALANGHDLVIITDHSDECPLCTPWENKVLSLTGLMTDHPDCGGTMDEARTAGLFHPNCLHSFSIYIPGLTARGGGDRQTPTENAAGYQNRQRQRYMERQVRAWKRKQSVAMDPFEERKCKAYVDSWQEKLRGLVTDTGLPRDYSREGGRVKLTEASVALLSKSRDTESQWERYVQRLGEYAPSSLQEFVSLKNAGGSEWKNLQSIYRFAGQHATANSRELLSNHMQAYNIAEKLIGYSLNPTHNLGKHKAIVFERTLGYNVSNVAELENEIRKGLSAYKATFTGGNAGFGDKYDVKMLAKGPKGVKIVLTAWIFDTGSTKPRMVTAYVDT